jgi:hypothetical protein
MADAEVGKACMSPESTKHEGRTLLPNTSSNKTPDVSPFESSPVYPQNKSGFLQVALGFLVGITACLIVQVVWGSHHYFLGRHTTCVDTTGSMGLDNKALLAPPYVGSTVREPFPPSTPTNVFPSLFPTDLGYAGKVATGAQPAIVATAPSYPIQSGAAQLVEPDTLGRHHEGSHRFDIFKKWGTLSPWYSVDRTAFGLNSGPETPETCRVTGLHLLHRHGARYPTAWCEFLVFVGLSDASNNGWIHSFVWRTSQVCD